MAGQSIRQLDESCAPVRKQTVLAPINNSTLLFIFYFIIVVHVFDAVKHLWASRTRARHDFSSDGPSGALRTKKRHRRAALRAIFVCLLCLPWVAYLSYIIGDDGRRIPLPVLILMAIYVIGLGVVAQFANKIAKET